MIYYVENLQVAQKRENIVREKFNRFSLGEYKVLDEPRLIKKANYRIDNVENELSYSVELENKLDEVAVELEGAISKDIKIKKMIKKVKKGKMEIGKLIDVVVDKMEINSKYHIVGQKLSDVIMKTSLTMGVVGGMSRVALANAQVVMVNSPINSGGLEDVGSTIIEITKPIMQLFASLGYPVTWGMLLAGILLVITGKREKGFGMMKWASIGYVALQIIPFGLGLLDTIGKALVNSLDASSVNMFMPKDVDTFSRIQDMSRNIFGRIM